MVSNLPEETIEKIYFKGIRDDIGSLFADPDYMYNQVNFNSDNITGATRILFPSLIKDYGTQDSIDGGSEFRYLDDNNLDVTQQIVIFGGKIYENALSNTPTLLKSGLTPGKCAFETYQNKLFISNGKNYPQIYNGTLITEMGAPAAYASGTIGNPNGAYFYEMTYVTSGGEERLGTNSNVLTVSGEIIRLELPLGYAGTTGRKIYRTEAGGTTLKLVTTINDNTTLEYLDNIADGSLGADIIAINNECPKPYFLNVLNSKLVGCKVDDFPTQIFVTDANIEVFDSAFSTNTSSNTGDNSKIEGMGLDYDKIILGTQKNNFVLDASGEALSVVRTRANLGLLSGYSVQTIPTQPAFPGGVMYLSTDNDVRLFNGNFNQPVPTSLDNLKTDNYSIVIKTSLDQALADSSLNISSAFFDYKYHLSINNQIFVYDVKTNQWFRYKIITENFLPSYNCLFMIGGNLFGGRVGSSKIEQFYSTVNYYDEIVSSFIQSEKISGQDAESPIGSLQKYFKELYIYFDTLENKTFNVSVVCDSDVNNSIEVEVDMGDGAFSIEAFGEDDFVTVDEPEDYRVIYINQYARYIEFTISSQYAINIRGYKLVYGVPSNKESR